MLPDAQIAPDPARLAQGWELRFIADEVRAVEMVRLYQQLNFETAIDPIRPGDMGESCADCWLVAQQRLKMIYTRPARQRMTPGAPGGLPVRDPIDQLLAEHRDIMSEIESLRRAIVDLRDRGDAAVPTALPALRSVGRMMATRLLLHARKEDEVLFPALEQALGTSDAPTAVMRQEHRAIHEHARLFRETLRELNEVEHPAIVAGGEVLRTLAERGGNAAALARDGEEIVSLLDLHFGKEENILFPMAREMLSDDEMSELGRRMETIDAARDEWDRPGTPGEGSR